MSAPSCFSRWAVLHAHDMSPVEGCVYTHRAKAAQRLNGMAAPEKFVVARVVVMDEATAHRIADAMAKAGT